MAHLDHDKAVNLLVLGDSMVGKTSLLKRYCDDEFQLNVQPTFGIDYTSKLTERNGVKLKVQVWDTAGQERFRTISPQFYRAAMGIIVAYDVTDLDTFKNVEWWLEQISMHGDTGVQRILVANKIDLDGRKVSTEEGVALANKFGMEFFEVSAKTAANVEDSFNSLIDLVARSRWDKPPDTIKLKPPVADAKGAAEERGERRRWRFLSCVSS